MARHDQKSLHTLFASSKRSFENAVRKFSPVIWTFAGLQFLRKQLFRTRSADGGHRFNLKLVRNPQFFAGAIVIESLHPMHDETLLKALQCEIFPHRSAIIGMSNRRFIVMFESLARNE